jgi:hypothetical protein
MQYLTKIELWTSLQVVGSIRDEAIDFPPPHLT